ncbi:MAG: flagellar motor protein MotB [Phycisphaeraceae bacterium]|nr:flagellar motor protein MotB [Phycisphaeraceae bacterium]
MAKRKRKSPPGIPEWVVTFGDLMSLLLVFFVLLAAFSDMKKPQEFQDLVKSLQQAFGITGGGGTSPDPESPFRSLPRILENLQLQPLIRPAPRQEPTLTRAPKTNNPRLREGDRFYLGSAIIFAPGSARIDAEQQQELALAATVLKGKNHKIELRGHADETDLETKGDSDPRGDVEYLHDLSYERAMAVAEFLADKQGLGWPRMRIMALGASEPFDPASSLTAPVSNRRVNVIQTELYVQDFQPR